VKALDATNEIIYAGLYEGTRGIIGKFTETGTAVWAYKTHLPVYTLQFDSKESVFSVTLMNPGVALEIHHYNISDGSKKFLYEYQASLTKIHDSRIREDSSFVLAEITGGLSLIISIS
jgi:hypothetical protein